MKMETFIIDSLFVRNNFYHISPVSLLCGEGEYCCTLLENSELDMHHILVSRQQYFLGFRATASIVRWRKNELKGVFCIAIVLSPTLKEP